MALARGRKTRSNIPASYHNSQSKAVRHLVLQKLHKKLTKQLMHSPSKANEIFDLRWYHYCRLDITTAEQIYCRKSGRGNIGEITVCAQ